MARFSIPIAHLTLLLVALQFIQVAAELSNGVYMISQTPIVQLGNTTYYLSLAGISEKVQLRKKEGRSTQKWEIMNTPGGVTLKNVAFGCYGYVGSLRDVLPIGAPLFCSPDSDLAQVFQPKQDEDGTYRFEHFNRSEPSLFYLMHTVPLGLSLGKKDTYGNISFVPFATKFATNFWFEPIGEIEE
ncbi:unnamed protein product [Rhizoctonia solani]|uniref:Ricin B lectin domain-containing protein n=1 Tax=Rhizoctonia solani TaxID=456999 RepID=A0A8H2XBB4_9AGAM|nr:unnamed protein product [Rhizoctonia solani]